MKISAIIAGLMAISSLMCNAANDDAVNYTLDVSMRNMPDSVQFTLSSDDGAYKQKAYTKGGRLHFGFNIAEDYPVQFVLSGRNPKDKSDRFILGFFGGKGVNHKLNSYAEGFSPDMVGFHGAPWDAAQMEYEQILKERQDIILSLSKNMKSFKDTTPSPEEKAKVDSVSKLILKAQDLYNAMLKEWATNNPTSPQVIDWLGWAYTQVTEDDLRKIYSEMPENMKESPYGKKFDKIIRIIDTGMIKEGDNLADYNIVAENIDGEIIDLSTIKTPYIIVEFGSLGCGVCRGAAKHEIPGLVEKYADKLTFVSYSVDDDVKRVKRMHEVDKATWMTLWNSDAATRDDTVIKYGVTGYPTFFIFDSNRNLVHTSTGWGPGSLEARISRYTDLVDK